MRVEQVDPYNVNVDEMNERKENLNLSELEKSVAERGVLEAPTVRERAGNNEVDYSAVIGQRRVLAAQGVGLESIPVRVVDWDDTESLLNSISENIESFQEDVTTEDRARAIQRLKTENDWSNSDVARELGTSENRIRDWLEPFNWEGTELEVNIEKEESALEGEKISPDDVGEKKMAVIRQTVGANEMGEELAKQVVKEDLSLHDTEEIAQRIERGQDVDDAVGELREMKREEREETMQKISTRVKWTGALAQGIEKVAKQRGTSDEDVVREAVEYYLNREGYL